MLGASYGSRNIALNALDTVAALVVANVVVVAVLAVLVVVVIVRSRNGLSQSVQ